MEGVKIEEQEEQKEETEGEEEKEEIIGTKIGIITHYFSKIGVGIIEIQEGKLKVGDKIRIKGATSDFEQKVDSMQIEHKSVKEAKAGQSIGLKVKEQVRANDVVYKL